MSEHTLDLDLEEVQNRRAANVLAQLIYNGVAIAAPESLAEDWRAGYQAARSAPGGFASRRLAFESAIADSPYHLHMQMEVDDAKAAFESHPEDQLRVFSAWETLRAQPRIEHTVQGILTKGSLNALVGAPGAKKTWLALDLAVCVASGKSWLGHETTNPSPFVISSEAEGRREISQAFYQNTDTLENLEPHPSVRALHGHAPAIAFQSTDPSLDIHDPDQFIRALHVNTPTDTLQPRDQSPENPIDPRADGRPPLQPDVDPPMGRESLLGASRVDSPRRREATPGMRAEPEPAPSQTLAKQGDGVGVLIYDEEGGLTRMWGRLARTLRGHHAPAGIPLYFVPPSYCRATQDHFVDSIAARARHLNVGLIIFDALTNLMSGTDENNVLSVEPVFENLRRLARESGATVLVIHHTNKQGLVRGSSFISSSVDHLLGVESDPHSDLVTISTIKARDLAPVCLTARAVFDSDPGPSFKLVPASPADASRSMSPATSAIVSLLAAKPRTFPQLTAQLADLSPGSIRNILHHLVTNGSVTRADGGSRGKKAFYCLASALHSPFLPPPSSLTNTPSPS